MVCANSALNTAMRASKATNARFARTITSRSACLKMWTALWHLLSTVRFVLISTTGLTRHYVKNALNIVIPAHLALAVSSVRLEKNLTSWPTNVRTSFVLKRLIFKATLVSTALKGVRSVRVPARPMNLLAPFRHFVMYVTRISS